MSLRQSKKSRPSSPAASSLHLSVFSLQSTGSIRPETCQRLNEEDVKSTAKQLEQSEKARELKKRKITKWALTFGNLGLIIVIVCLSIHLAKLKSELEGNKAGCVTTLDDCPVNANKHGDGFCDDDMNVAECDYDGGDCCRAQVVAYFCFKCECIQSGCQSTSTSRLNGIGTRDPETGQEGPKNISYCIRPQWAGDGECDPVCNTPWCNFDEGDCEGVSEPIPITMPDCPAEYWVGNGKCDDETNIPECEYDGGDCCLEPYVQGLCTLCVCYNEEMQ